MRIRLIVRCSFYAFYFLRMICRWARWEERGCMSVTKEQQVSARSTFSTLCARCSLMPFYYTSTLDRCRRLVNRFFIRNAFGYFNTALTEFDGGGSLVFWHTGICPESNSISVVFDRLRTQFTYNFVAIATLQKWNKRFGQICRANQVCQRDLNQDETNKKSQLIKHHKSSRVNTVIFYEANYLETDNRFDMVAHLAVSTSITWLNGFFHIFCDAWRSDGHSAQWAYWFKRSKSL